MDQDTLIQEDQKKLSDGVVKALECVAAISSAAAVINPIFGLAGSLIRLALHSVDNEEISTLKREFGSVHSALDRLSEQNRCVLQEIQIQTHNQQYHDCASNLKYQFGKYMEALLARAELKERKIEDFKESYIGLQDQSLNTLYDGVTGVKKAFARPILEVYRSHSQGDRQVMERLCTRLTYLFCIGLIAHMGFTALIGDDEEAVVVEWSRKMEDVQRSMQEELSRWD